jgi:N6-adenosine-specific RNA methylase IME4
MKIDSEFKELIPTLQDQQLILLTENIKKDGCRDPLVVWQEQDILLDGHNRLEICNKNNIKYTVKTICLKDRESAKGWIINNQMGRRNLTASQWEYLLGLQYNLEKRQDGGHGKQIAGGQIVTPNTSEKLAKQYGVSARTVKRAGKTAEMLTNNKPALESIMAGTGTLADLKKEKRKNNIIEQRKQIEEGVKNIDNEPYSVVVIDPPWKYGGEYDPNNRRATSPYPEMSQEEIIKDIERITFNDNSILFLWTTHRFIWDAKEILDHFGFNYKLTLVWDKDKMGLGTMFRQQVEFCLVGFKGKPFLQNTTWRDIIREPRRQHSRKPELFYQMVEEITAGKKLDFYSRTTRKGFSSYGNDTAKF